MWRHVRAALIAIVISGAILNGAPTPRSAADRDQVAVIAGSGIADLTDHLEGARRWLYVPFRPVFERARIEEHWVLFSKAPPVVDRLQIEIRSGQGPWRLLYRAGDPDHAFLAGRLHHRRLRGAWNPTSRGDPRPGYQAFVDWVARETFALFPDVDAVRISFERLAVSPRGGAKTTGVTGLVEIRTRAGHP